MAYNILVIEDNPADAALIKIYLEDSNLNHKIHHTESLGEGLDIIQKKEIDLVLLDLSLNDSIGFNTLKSYMERETDTPVIVMTGMNSEIVGIQSVRAGAQDFLVKGEFDQRSLVRSIRYSLQRFQTQAKLRKAAKELTIKEKRNQEFQKITRIGHWEMDLVSSSMKWNEEMYRIFGYQSTVFSPTLTDYLSFVHLEDRQRIQDFFQEASFQDGQVHHTKHRIIVNPGKPRLLSLQAKAKKDEFSEKIVLIGSVQDITEQQKEDEEPQPSAAQPAAPQEKLLMGMTMRLLKPIHTSLHLLNLLDTSQIPYDQREIIESLKLSVDELFSAANNLANLNLLQDPSFQPNLSGVVNLRELLQNIELVFKNSEDSQFRIKKGKHLPEKVRTDPFLLALLLNSLANCGLRHDHKEMRSTLAIDSLEEDGKSFLTLTLEQVNCPIKPEELNAMLSQNNLQVEQLDASRPEELLHLTLSAAQIIKDKLGGAIEGNFQAGKTKGLSIRLPIGRLSPSLSPEETEGLQRSIRILLVEDNSMNRIAIRRSLTNHAPNIRVDVAENGLAGLQHFQKYEYDLILMDLDMPVMDGNKAAIRIRTMSNVPIFALTTEASKQEEENCYAAGFNEYLLKPPKVDDLLNRIKKYVE